MDNRFNIEVEDYRIYFVVGAVSMMLWIILPVLQGFLSGDSLVASNAWLKIGGQLILAGIGLSIIPLRFRFAFLVVFAIYLTDFSQGVLAFRCELADQRFVFDLGDMPTCLFSNAI